MDDSDGTSDDGTTRRELLAGAGLAAVGGLAGCSALDWRDSDTGCLRTVSDESGGTGIHEVRVEARDPVTLVVELTDDEETLSQVEFLYVTATGGDLTSYVPYRELADGGDTDPPLSYEIPLGSPPHHGEYEVVLDGVGERRTLDTRTVSLSCD